MSTRRLNLRFNLERDHERQAWDYLQGVEGSKNSAIILAINAYAESQEKRMQEDDLLNRIVEAFRTELKNAQIQASQPPRHAPPTPVNDPATEQAENEDTVLEFLRFFE